MNHHHGMSKAPKDIGDVAGEQTSDERLNEIQNVQQRAKKPGDQRADQTDVEAGIESMRIGRSEAETHLFQALKQLIFGDEREDQYSDHQNSI